MFFYVLILFIVLQRMMELMIAKRNRKYIQAIGGFEVGNRHYPAIVLLHVLFFISLLIEGNQTSMPTWWPIPFIVFVFAQLVRIWVISTLGRFWNTRIFIVPDSKPIKTGPYRYLRHPNYLTVIIELLSIPLIFGAYYTAILFSVMNALILLIRISIEEQALVRYTDYLQQMDNTPRFIHIKQTKNK